MAPTASRNPTSPTVSLAIRPSFVGFNPPQEIDPAGVGEQREQRNGSRKESLVVYNGACGWLIDFLFAANGLDVGPRRACQAGWVGTQRPESTTHHAMHFSRFAPTFGSLFEPFIERRQRHFTFQMQVIFPASRKKPPAGSPPFIERHVCDINQRRTK